MTTKYDTVVTTKASISKAMDYYSHPENLPRVHPGYIKDVKIISIEGKTIIFEQHMEMMGRKLRAVNTITRKDAERKVELNTVEGDGKGSKITIELKEVPVGTELRYLGEMELGPLGFLFKGKAKQISEKIAGDDAKAIDAM